MSMNEMKHHFRDSVFGLLVRLVSGRRFLKFTGKKKKRKKRERENKIKLKFKSIHMGTISPREGKVSIRERKKCKSAKVENKVPTFPDVERRTRKEQIMH